ncbi:MAG: biotin--[acetyl-CoA-carboxylase] ligase [Acidimicrobiales bacterium]|nr:biotin--[acetyl-CoA-carboxylase] ligase [Acidimicrobiales bacterium]
MESHKFDAVKGTRFQNITWVSQIPSTNTALLELARDGGNEGEVMIADLQTQGRGRRGRIWTAPPGTSLMMSVLLRPPPAALAVQKASLVTSALAVATVKGVLETMQITLGIKWPNDLVVDNATDIPGDPGYRKVAGILTETLIDDGSISALVVGMGLNTGWGQVPPELELVATSLDLLTRSSVDRPSLALKILQNFENEYAHLLELTGSEQLLREVRHHSSTLGRRVRVHFDNSKETPTLEGHAVDLTENGQLVVQTDRGDLQTVSVADVEHLRLDAR